MKNIRMFALLLSLIFASEQFQPRQAHAVAGAITGNVPAMIVGGALIGASLLTGLIFIKRSAGYDGGFALRVGGIAVIGVGGLIGLIILDGTQPQLQYVTLDEKQAHAAGVTTAELAAYNANLDEISVVADSVIADMIARGDSSAEFAKQKWLEYGAILDPGAFSAVQKVSAKAIHKLSQESKPASKVR